MSYGLSRLPALIREIRIAQAAESYTKRFLELGSDPLVDGRKYARPGKPGIDRLSTTIDADEKAAAADARRE